jgi:signal transduction histidine kinase
VGFEGQESTPGAASGGPARAGQDRKWSRRIFLQGIPITLAANTVVAGFLTLLAPWHFRSNLIYSQCIGLTILLLSWALHWLLANRLAHWLITTIAIPAGGLLGLTLAVWIEGGTLQGLASALPVTAACVVVFGVAMSYYFDSRVNLAKRDAQLKEEARAREEGARRLAEAELKLLQAQIEPHFLFNTLSNVLQLVDSDPPRAKRMLLNLTGYLRGSLRRTRAGPVTLGEELDLVRAYLEIQAVRMGGRLAWQLSCPDEVRDVTLPPLLLQPLVENAVKHGLEPKPAGGAVTVTAAREGEDLILEVRDDGLGLDPHRPAGVGLTNVRQRISALSKGRGSLSLRPLPEGGLSARIVLPLAPAPAAEGVRA